MDKYQRLVLFGDTGGINQLLPHIPQDYVCSIVGAEIRPQYFGELDQISRRLHVPLVIQPRSDAPKRSEFIRSLAALRPDLLIANSYSMLIGKDVLDVFKHNAVNVHLALLPLNRGPHPIQWCLIKGEPKTGVTIHRITDVLDGGDICFQYDLTISHEDTWVSVRDKLNHLTSVVLERHMSDLLNGRCVPMPQDNRKATVNKRLPLDSLRIDFAKMADSEIFNLIRAQVSPLAGAYIENRGEKIRFKDRLNLEEVVALRRQYAPETF